ncbi:aminopeptidase [Brevibacillus sp. SYP-B805]|uniref:aminopeptidase n=1 Tax=Brevibacillus sp. SYP-B805 TaxID=1578199 RepID=UPI0013EC62FA|nr:aminopeptidase [Brevibacillus sp. SYP-B805]NGQ94126.1 aminopeptidase [Brevibacillus sp. SYP-B805]
MSDFVHSLEKYAQLALKVGVNLQAGQTLVIRAPITTAEFVRTAVKAAYEAGARQVYVDWEDDQVRRLRVLHAPQESLAQFPAWKAEMLEQYAREGAAFLTVVSRNADLLKGADPQRAALQMKADAGVLGSLRQYTRTGRVCWAIVAVPSPDWAARVFPELDENARMEKLWQAVFRANRIDSDDPVQAWQDHLAQLVRKRDYLNRKRYRRLHFKAPGTELAVDLPELHVWNGGPWRGENGTVFVPNLPTEEVFTMPKKDGVNGVVTSTKPLNYGGSLIDRFTLRFENGRIVDFSAETGREALKNLIETDEGAHYLGEIALVPHHSPISEMNILFYDTLYDENASCHLAIGNAYPVCLEGGTRMTGEELARCGANISSAHSDFMIGSADMEIDGETAEGMREPIFRKGNWAI